MWWKEHTEEKNLASAESTKKPPKNPKPKPLTNISSFVVVFSNQVHF